METLALVTVIMFFTAGLGPAATVGSPVAAAAGNCVLEARYDGADDLLALSMSGSPTASDTELSLPEKPLQAPELVAPVPSATLAEVEAAAEVMRACFAARKPLQGLSGFSDTYLRRLIAADGAAGIKVGLDLLQAPTNPALGMLIPANSQPESGLLADGRVVIGRTVTAELPSSGPLTQFDAEVWFIFIDSSAGWKLDDVLFLTLTVDGTPWP